MRGTKMTTAQLRHVAFTQIMEKGESRYTIEDLCRDCVLSLSNALSIVSYLELDGWITVTAYQLKATRVARFLHQRDAAELERYFIL